MMKSRQVTVRSLFEEIGGGKWLDNPNINEAVSVADFLADRMFDPIERIAFLGGVASQLSCLPMGIANPVGNAREACDAAFNSTSVEDIELIWQKYMNV